ncbi:MAG: hypothetical protein GY703_22140, partial [Gammaproteobacteria bacterium]|nr:hypothetical protein [Gammaproteobacteria bacterium]
MFKQLHTPYRIRRLLMGMVILSLSSMVNAAEVTVLPGSGTLTAAIDLAASGDVLVLQEGGYMEDSIILDKSLTIRSTNSGNDTAISATSFQIAGADIDVTIQGLGLAVSLGLEQAASIRILENRFLNGADILGGNYKTSEGDGELFVIGNRFSQNGTIVDLSANGFYVAGNTLNAGYISANESGWIVGNSVYAPTNETAIRVLSGAVSMKIIGNRISYFGNNNDSYNGIAS